MDGDTEGIIKVTGGNVWYRISGEGPGLPLLMLHGGPGSMSYDGDPLRQLGSERPVIQYDQLGCGRSDRPTDTKLWTVGRYVEELEQVIDYLQLKDFHLLGNSWGTMLAASYLMKNPTGAKSVIFSGPALDMKRWEKDQQSYYKQLPKDVRETLERCEKEQNADSEECNQAMMVYYKRHVYRKDPWPKELIDNMEKMNTQISDYMLGTSQFKVTGTLKDFDATTSLLEIVIPSLYLCGRFDQASPESAAYYANLTPGAEMHVFENSSHAPRYEEPEAYIKIVRDWLSRKE